MTENVSMSRYSIVERLTQEKLKIMTEKQNIEGNIAKLKEKINYTTKKYKDQIDNLHTEIKDKQAEKDFELNDLKEQIAFIEKGKTTQMKLCDDKIKEIDKAMEALQEISKSSAEEAKR